MICKKSEIIFFIIFFTFEIKSHDSIISCYHDIARSDVTNQIDPFLCTHIMLINSCFLNNSDQIVFPHIEDMKDVLDLRNTNKHLKILLTFLPRSESMRKIIYDDKKFNNLIYSIFDFVQFSGLDGFDLDWEFPAWGRGSKPSERDKFTELVQKLYNLFNNRNLTKKYLLTSAVSGPYTIALKSYNLSAIKPFVGFNSPLYAEPYEIYIAARMNSAYSTEYYLKNGVPSHKLVFGIPTYGRGYKLLEKHIHFPYAPAIGSSFLGSSYSYIISCNYLIDRSFKFIWNNHAASGYLVNNNRDWIGLETERSVKEKASYAAKKKLGGIMIFALFEDDYKGVCPGSKKKKMFLTKTAKKAFLEARKKMNIL
ncbi:Cht11 [Strongyloides ratti]|uniref:Cht11 n=1 Tax=Strongyloides ratti TaxID=34506 RepID=A0A090LI41_STRRB|nr:Cht11 [Strongyloides ratti]CEF67170.1 Cht11 [Strongyloides ratti]